MTGAYPTNEKVILSMIDHFFTKIDNVQSIFDYFPFLGISVCKHNNNNYC